MGKNKYGNIFIQKYIVGTGVSGTPTPINLDRVMAIARDVHDTVDDCILHDMTNMRNWFDGTIASKVEVDRVTSQLAQAERIASGVLIDLIQVPTQANINSYFSGGDSFKQGDTPLFNEYMALFENLQLENSDYISVYDLGADSGGWRKFKYYVYEPEKYEKTIILGAGLHGGEKVAIISLYNFLKLLSKSWAVMPQLAYIRQHVRLVVMPIQHPFGVYNNNRVNENGVDLNRNSG